MTHLKSSTTKTLTWKKVKSSSLVCRPGSCRYLWIMRVGHQLHYIGSLRKRADSVAKSTNNARANSSSQQSKRQNCVSHHHSQHGSLFPEARCSRRVCCLSWKMFGACQVVGSQRTFQRSSLTLAEAETAEVLMQNPYASLRAVQLDSQTQRCCSPRKRSAESESLSYPRCWKPVHLLHQAAYSKQTTCGSFNYWQSAVWSHLKDSRQNAASVPSNPQTSSYWRWTNLWKWRRAANWASAKGTLQPQHQAG